MTRWDHSPEIVVAWRTDPHEPRLIFAVQPGREYYQTDHDRLIGVMDTSSLAKDAVRAHNRMVNKWPPRRDSRGLTRPGKESDF